MKKMNIRCMISICLIAVLCFGLLKYYRNFFEKTEYILLTGNIESSDMDQFLNCFREEIEKMNSSLKILQLEDKQNAEISQAQILNETLSDNTKCVVVDAVNISNLSGTLKKCMEKGITVVSYDNKTEADCRTLHAGAVEPVIAGADIMMKAAEACGGRGDMLVLCESHQSPLMSSLLMGIREEYETRKYPEMELADILFLESSENEEIERLTKYLDDYGMPEIVICLSEQVMNYISTALTQTGECHGLKMICIGNPETIREKAENCDVSMQILYYDKGAFGKWLAELSVQIAAGKIQGKVGEKVTIGKEKYEVQRGNMMIYDGIPGTEIYMYKSYQCLSIG